MGEMTFEGLDALYDHLVARGGATPQAHGPLGQFYAAMANYKNPNTCGCRKGQKALNAMVSICTGFSTSLPSNTAAKALFDNNTVTLNHNGATIARF